MTEKEKCLSTPPDVEGWEYSMNENLVTGKFFIIHTNMLLIKQHSSRFFFFLSQLNDLSLIIY